MVAETRLAAEAMRLQSSAHGVRMETEFGSDGADLPVLNVEVATNGGFQFGGNHASPPAMGERINPATPATTDLAYDPAALRWPAGNAAEARGRRGRQDSDRRPLGQAGRSGRGLGRFIRHAGALALAIVALAVAMILTPFRGLLMAAVGLAALQTEGFLAAVRTAVALSAVTATAEIKDRATSRPVTNPLSEDQGTAIGHRSPQAVLDNRGPSWQDEARTWMWRVLNGSLPKQPGFPVPAWGCLSYQRVPRGEKVDAGGWCPKFVLLDRW